MNSNSNVDSKDKVKPAEQLSDFDKLRPYFPERRIVRTVIKTYRLNEVTGVLEESKEGSSTI